MEEIQRYECLYNKFSKDYKNRRTRENAWETIGQKFGLTAEEAEKNYKNIRTSYTHTHYLKKVKSVPSGSMLSSMFSLSSSSQNNTEKQITSQKSCSSIDCLHFNFDLVGKKIPSASLFYRLIRYKRFNGNQGIALIASIASVVFHHGKLFSSDRNDSSDRDDYLKNTTHYSNKDYATVVIQTLPLFHVEKGDLKDVLVRAKL